MKIFIPFYVEKIIDRLLDKGFDTYAVGGSIRDSLMNKEPIDWDIATLAEPYEVIEVFSDKKVIKTGEKYGTVTIIVNEGKVEVTTFRSEGGYTDGRHPDWIHFEKSIEIDLSRRDFTINAIAYNKKRGIVDPFNGLDDIKNKVVRAVGNPKDRFLEDSLRMIRAVRFFTTLSFELETNTINTIKSLTENIKSVSSERINDELFKILIEPNSSRGIEMLLETGLLKHILPEIELVYEFEQGNKDFVQYILCIIDKMPNLIHIRLAALFLYKRKDQYRIDEYSVLHGVNNDNIAFKAMKRLCCSNNLIKKVIILIKNHEIFDFPVDRTGIKRLIRNVGKSNIYDLISLLKAEAICSKNKLHEKDIIYIERVIKEIFRNREPIDLNDLDINGNDIMKMGFNEGEIIGSILDYLMEEVLTDPKLNSKELLMKIVRDRWEKIE